MKIGLRASVRALGVLGLMALTAVMAERLFVYHAANENLRVRMKLLKQRAAKLSRQQIELASDLRVLDAKSAALAWSSLQRADLRTKLEAARREGAPKVPSLEESSQSAGGSGRHAPGPAMAGLGEVERNLGAMESQLGKLMDAVDDRSETLATIPSIRPADGWLSSEYGYRVSPVDGSRDFHNGLDIAAPKGTEVHATAAGRVVTARSKGALGRLIEIDHGHGVKTRYAHNGKVFVKRGDQVERGDAIATVGMTGRTTGPHVHYEIHLKRRSVNPARFLNLADLQPAPPSRMFASTSAHRHGLAQQGGFQGTHYPIGGDDHVSGSASSAEGKGEAAAAATAPVPETAPESYDRSRRFAANVWSVFLAGLAGLLCLWLVFRLLGWSKRLWQVGARLVSLPFRLLDSWLAAPGRPQPEAPVSYWDSPASAEPHNTSSVAA